MAEHTPPPALDRIERAIARIDAATAARDRAAKTAAHRHAALRAQIEQAVAALDGIVARSADD